MNQRGPVAGKSGSYRVSPASTGDAGSRERLDPPATVLVEVQQERERQDAKWGEQNHPNGTGDARHLLRDVELPTYGTLCYRGRYLTDRVSLIGDLTYADVLVEEFFEALACEDPEHLRVELIQVAAVAVAWVEKIDRDAS